MFKVNQSFPVIYIKKDISKIIRKLTSIMTWYNFKSLRRELNMKQKNLEKARKVRICLQTLSCEQKYPIIRIYF
ncbi:hypothetical protein CVD28_26175 [Bacillus sp. M6-12]|nr:hypothetical protein CVD28_26175 [Bacillus sp. M6-12]